MSSVGAFAVVASAALGQLEAGSTHEHLKELSTLIGQWKVEGIDAGQETSGYMKVEWMHDKNFILTKSVTKDPNGKDLPFTTIIGWDPVNKQIQEWGFGGYGGYGHCTWKKSGNIWTLTFEKPWVRWNGETLTGTLTRTIVDDNTLVDEGTFKRSDDVLTSKLTAKRVQRAKSE